MRLSPISRTSYPQPIQQQRTRSTTTAHTGRRISRLSQLLLLSSSALLTSVVASTAHAALPESIQGALARADLTPADISILITPVGHKNASRLPAAVPVLDRNDRQDATANTANDNSNTSSKIETTAVTPVIRQDVAEQERALHNYTDDAYTYQSLEDTSNVLSTANTKTTVTRNITAQTTTTQATASQAVSAPTIRATPLLSHQPDVARTPASTMKLVPTLIALDTLGADFVWQTRVYHTGIIIGDQLHGDLIIQGSGDPKMTHERLQQMLYHIQKAGIRHIDGDIIIDSSVFSNVSKDPAAFDHAPLRPYNASPDGFLVNFNSVGIKSQPLGGDAAALTYTPQLANYQLPSRIDTRQAACSQASNSLDPEWQADRLIINAKLPSSCGEHIFYVAYPDAKDFAARVLAAKWQTLGNTLSGTVISQETPYRLNGSPIKNGLTALPLSPLPIVSYPSLSLTQQIYDINHFSNNVMAEQVALSIGAYDTPDSLSRLDDKQTTNAHSATSLYQYQPPHTNYPAALERITAWWQTHLSTPPPHLTNGSGLCRDCTISAANLSELLGYAYTRPSFGAYVDSLGVAGVSGTIAAHGERLPDSAAIGRAWIKTGTLNNVTSMAGYVKGQSGQDYSVVGLINTEQALNAYKARPVLDAMLDWTAQQ